MTHLNADRVSILCLEAPSPRLTKGSQAVRLERLPQIDAGVVVLVDVGVCLILENSTAC